MTKYFAKTSALCVACSMLAASAWAQSESQTMPANDSPATPVNRSWSTKHLSATGRMNDGAVRASKLVGAQVNDLSGHRAGQIQDIILNPVSGRIDFALISVSATDASSSGTTVANGANGKLVPVPWSLLRSTSSSSQYATGSEQPSFTLKADQSKLIGAPAVDWSDLSQSQWRQRIYSYYGVTPQSSVGGAESPEGEIKGEGARKLQESNPENQPPPQQQQQNQRPNQ